MKNTFWRDAAKGGIIIGAIEVAVSYIKTWLAMAGSMMGFLFTILEVVAVAYVIYKLCKQRSMLYDSAEGYSYGQNMSFVVALMLLAGVIYGAGYYFLVNFVAPEFFEKSFSEAFNLMYQVMGDVAEQSIDAAFTMIRSPFYWLFYGVAAMIIYGGIIGLFVSAFVKRKPDIFSDNNSTNEQ